MNRQRLALLAVPVLALAAACAPSYPGAALHPGTHTVDRNTSWYADLTSSTPAAGAAEMSGEASMAPGAKVGATRVSLTLTGAVPGGVHPWEVRHGRCGADEGLLGLVTAYTPIRIQGDGNASTSVTLPVQVPAGGSYFVSVLAARDDGMVIACGNLAPPMTGQPIAS